MAGRTLSLMTVIPDLIEDFFRLCVNDKITLRNRYRVKILELIKTGRYRPLGNDDGKTLTCYLIYRTYNLCNMRFMQEHLRQDTFTVSNVGILCYSWKQILDELLLEIEHREKIPCGCDSCSEWRFASEITNNAN